MKRTYDFKTLIAFGLALLILTGIAITTYRSIRQALADDRLVLHTHQVLARLQEVLVTMVDVETVVRGYVITGQETFLGPYERRLRELPERLSEVRALTADNPRQQERLTRLEPIVQAKLAFLADQLNARRDRGAETAQALISSGTGKSLMDSIRAVVASMEDEERLLLDQRIVRNAESRRFALAVIVGGNTLALLFLAGAIAVIYKENDRRKRAEQAAIQERNRLDLIVTSLGEGVVAADAQGNFSLFNPMAADLIGIRATGVRTEAWAEQNGVFHTDGITPYPPDQLPLVRTLRGESCQNVELCIRNSTQPEGVLLSVTGRPLRDEIGTVLGGVVVFSDITQRKRDEEEIERKSNELAHAYAELDRTRLQQLQTKDQLLSHVSHELRTPLTAAYQFVEILRDGLAGELSKEQQEYSEIALRNLKQLRAMIGDLLDATRLESAKLTIEPARMNLADVMRDVCRTLYSIAAEKRIALDNRIANLPDVCADTTRVRQIFTNLLHNAIKFTEDGRITLEASVSGDQPQFVRVTVADTGRGMEAEALGRIFGRLYQAGDQRDDSRQGLGLGLYICKELVTRQGGDIWAESELGKGSTFHCTFPVFSDATQRERGILIGKGDSSH